MKRIDIEPSAAQRVASYWWGGSDGSVAWWLSTCRRIAISPISQSLYLASVAEDKTKFSEIKDWAYDIAASLSETRGSGVRSRRLIESYREEWGHQAARDGVFKAIWPQMEIPGAAGRAEKLKCGRQAYIRVMNEVEREAVKLIMLFDDDMEMCRSKKFSQDFISRWELNTGKKWSSANWTD